MLTHGNEVWGEYSYLGGTDAIAMGCLTALTLARRRLPRRELVICFALGAALTGFVLCFSNIANVYLGRMGLDMSILGLGACLLIAGFAQTQWFAPAALRPLLWMGRRSYEVYLTHMFVVLGLFAVFVHLGKPLYGAWPLFPVVIVTAGLLGTVVARLYTEPMNAWLRWRTVEDPRHMGAVLGNRSGPTLHTPPAL